MELLVTCNSKGKQHVGIVKSGGIQQWSWRTVTPPYPDPQSIEKVEEACFLPGSIGCYGYVGQEPNFR